jgi:uridine kinase
MPIIVAVAGISGSGKSTVADRIVERFGADNCVIISSDRYYKEQVGKTLQERNKTNYDEPAILDLEFLARDLAQLRLHNPIKAPKYEFSTHSREKNADGSEVREDIHPPKIVIVDGILIYEPEYLRNKFDVPVFVDTPPEVAVLYRIGRDIRDRGRDFASASKQCLTQVFPSQNQYVLPHKLRKDMLIVVNNKYYENESDIQLDMDHVFDAIEKKLLAQYANVHSIFTSAPTPAAAATSESKLELPRMGMHTIL